MKRFLFLTVVAAAALLSGCSGAGKSPEAVRQAITGPFKMTAELYDGDYRAEVAVYRFGMMNYRVEFLAPQEVNGLVLAREGDRVTCAFSDISFEFDYQGMQPYGIIRALSALDAAASREAMTVSGEDGDITEFDGVTVRSVNGIPTELIFDRIVLKGTSFEIIQQQSPQL